MRQHTTHFDDCGCLTDRHKKQLVSLIKLIQEIQKEVKTIKTPHTNHVKYFKNALERLEFNACVARGDDHV